MKEITVKERGTSNLALRIFGMRKLPKPETCMDSTLEIPFLVSSPDVFLEKLRAITPQGETPIAYSLQKAALDFPREAKHKIIILITDGEESCRGDPCAIAREIHQQKGIESVVHVIGFNVKPEVEEQLKCIAREGGGTFATAEKADELKIALDQVISATPLALILATENETPLPADNKEKESFPKPPRIAKTVALKKDIGAGTSPITPKAAFLNSFLFPSLGVFKLGHQIQGAKVFATESLLLGFTMREIAIDSDRKEDEIDLLPDGTLLRRAKRRDATPFEAWEKELLIYGLASFHLSQSIGAALSAVNIAQNNGRAWKNPWRAASLSAILPGLGLLYVGDDPEDALEILAFQGYFVYRSFSPIPAGVSFTAEQESDLRKTNIQLAIGLYASQAVISFAAAKLHNIFVKRKISQAERNWRWSIVPGNQSIYFLATKKL